jgi:dTDP-4-dehydrorhamnose reductase
MPRQRVMILGVTGALGGRLAELLGERRRVFSPLPRSRQTLRHSLRHVEWIDSPFDAMEPDSIDALVERVCPDAIINCVAITPKHMQADDISACTTINGLLPHRLAACAERYGAYLIQIGTDAVFSGKSGSYTEADAPDPVDHYGRTKLQGEVSGPGCITLRTTFFGATPTGGTLVDWFIRQHGQRVSAFANYRFSGLWIGTLASTIDTLLDRSDRLSGVHHVGGEGISKLRLLEAINTQLELGVSLQSVAEPRCDRTLDSTRFWSLLGQAPPAFGTMVEAMLPELRLTRQASDAAGLRVA